MEKPSSKEEELKQMTARIDEVNIYLNLDKRKMNWQKMNLTRTKPSLLAKKRNKNANAMAVWENHTAFYIAKL